MPAWKREDVVLMTNFRSDRAREISVALGDAHFDKFACNHTTIHLATMTKYDGSFPYPILFPKDFAQKYLGGND